MKDGIFIVSKNDRLTENVYRMHLCGDTSDVTAPGQFINIKIDGLYLRRPISVFDCEDGEVQIIYKVVGKGTKQLSCTPVGAKLYVLTGLGNGYNTALAGDRPLLIGGGVGVPPLYMLAKKLIADGIEPHVILGFNTADEIFCENDFKQLGLTVSIATVDGSRGICGFVTDAFPNEYSYFYTCGPEPMLRAVYSKTTTSGQFSFEERMGCGFGACMGCSCKTITGYKRICKDGPVLEKEEILWDA